MAWFLQRAEQPERGAALLGFVQQQFVMTPGAQRNWRAVATHLQTDLSPQELQAALDQGVPLDVDTVVAELLGAWQ